MNAIRLDRNPDSGSGASFGKTGLQKEFVTAIRSENKNGKAITYQVKRAALKDYETVHAYATRVAAASRLDENSLNRIIKHAIRDGVLYEFELDNNIVGLLPVTIEEIDIADNVYKSVVIREPVSLESNMVSVFFAFITESMMELASEGRCFASVMCLESDIKNSFSKKLSAILPVLFDTQEDNRLIDIALFIPALKSKPATVYLESLEDEDYERIFKCFSDYLRTLN